MNFSCRAHVLFGQSGQPDDKPAFFVRNKKGSLSPCCQFHWDDIHKLKDPCWLEKLSQFSQVSLQDGKQEYLNQMKEFAVRRLVSQ